MPDVLTSIGKPGWIAPSLIWQTATNEKPTISVWAFRLWCFRIGKINTFLLLFPMVLQVIALHYNIVIHPLIHFPYKSQIRHTLDSMPLENRRNLAGIVLQTFDVIPTPWHTTFQIVPLPLHLSTVYLDDKGN